MQKPTEREKQLADIERLLAEAPDEAGRRDLERLRESLNSPEMIDMAGGINCFGDKETGSFRLDWDAVVESQPEIIILMLCGYTVQRSLEDVPLLSAKPGWDDLPAVRHDQIFAVDAGAYTSRSGPRLVQGLEIIAEILRPDGGVLDAGLGQRTIQIQHADQAGPGAAPVGDSQDGALVGDQAMQNVMRILPDALRDNQRGLGINPRKNAHAFLLGADEPVFFIILVGMGPDQFITGFRQRCLQHLLHFGLFSPAGLVGGEAQITIGDQGDLFPAKFGGLIERWHLVSRHEAISMEKLTQNVASSSDVLSGKGSTEREGVS